MSARTGHLYGCSWVSLERKKRTGPATPARALEEGTLTQPCLFGRSSKTRGLRLCQLSINALVKSKPDSSLSGLLAPRSELRIQDSPVMSPQGRRSLWGEPPASWRGQACGLLRSVIWEYELLPLGELKTVELCWP